LLELAERNVDTNSSADTGADDPVAGKLTLGKPLTDTSARHANKRGECRLGQNFVHEQHYTRFSGKSLGSKL
jgi:hypothetical protein